MARKCHVLLDPGSFPVATGFANIVDLPTRLEVDVTVDPPVRASRGQSDVPLMNLELVNPGIDGITGTVLVALGRAGEAFSYFQQAVEMEPNDGPERAQYLEELAFCHEALGEHDTAEQVLRAAVRTHPDPRIRANLAAMLRNHGKREEADEISGTRRG